MRTKYCPECASTDIYFECNVCYATWEHHVERPLDPPFEEEELDPETKKAQDELRDVLLSIADIENRDAWLARWPVFDKENEK